MKIRTTVSTISGKGVLDQIPGELLRLWPGMKAFVIADGNTWKAAGERVEKLIKASGIQFCVAFIFPAEESLHADTKRIAELCYVLADAGPVVPVAVGSGTLNDIVKRASFEKGLSYMCVPTAPSVDGYTSFGAAVTINGFKTTLPCDAPKAIVADEEIMSSAPYRLIAAGYGDLAAKLVSGRDWLLAETLGLETIDPSVWELSQGKLLPRLSCPEKLRLRDPSAVRGIFDGLCDTGLAMQDQGDSRPASGAEHHVSHCLEMRGLSVNGIDVLHGEKVAAGTLLSAAMSKYLFAFSGEEIARLAAAARETGAKEREAEVRRIYQGTGITSSAVDDAIKISLQKLVTGKARVDRLAAICGKWDSLKKRLMAGRPGYEELCVMFEKAGCPSFSAINLTPLLAGWALHAAQTIRNRYTVLDLAYELGCLDSGIERVLEGLV